MKGNYDKKSKRQVFSLPLILPSLHFPSPILRGIRLLCKRGVNDG